MVVLDTNIVIERIKRRDEIKENITAITFVEYPKIVYYKKFYGKILFPNITDFMLTHEIQNKLIVLGKAKTFADLLIASICINRNEELITKDGDFLDIA
jgi:predicted nucleic acid-binding protein